MRRVEAGDLQCRQLLFSGTKAQLSADTFEQCHRAFVVLNLARERSVAESCTLLRLPLLISFGAFFPLVFISLLFLYVLLKQ